MALLKQINNMQQCPETEATRFSVRSPSHCAVLHPSIKDTLDPLNFKTNTIHGFAQLLAQLTPFCFSGATRVEAANSPLTGSIRTAAERAAGSGPRTATTSCWHCYDVSPLLRVRCDGDTDASRPPRPPPTRW